MTSSLDAALLDSEGDPTPDALPLWLEAQRLRLGIEPPAFAGFVAMAVKASRRTAERWVSGALKPDPVARRALRLALQAPAEAEVMRCLIGALRAAQASTIDHGAGVARKAAPSGGARREPPAPAPPTTPSPAALAAALARRRKV